QQSAPQGGEELHVGHTPNPGDVLNVSKDGRFLHWRLKSEASKTRAERRRTSIGTTWSNNECVGQKAQHDADDGKDQGGHRIGISLAQLVCRTAEADQAYH